MIMSPPTEQQPPYTGVLKPLLAVAQQLRL